MANIHLTRCNRTPETCRDLRHHCEGKEFLRKRCLSIRAANFRCAWIDAWANTSRASTDSNCQNTIGAVSQSGEFFAWSSDCRGKDSNNHNRCDVFIVNLAAAQGASD